MKAIERVEFILLTLTSALFIISIARSTRFSGRTLERETKYPKAQIALPFESSKDIQHYYI
jgi:hypothetical protein